MPAAPEFTPLQMAVAATTAVVVLAVGFAGYQMGPSEHLTSARKKQAAAPRAAAAAATVHAAPAATPAATPTATPAAAPAASSKQKASPTGSAALKTSPAGVAETTAAAQPPAKASALQKSKASKADALFASLIKAFKAAPANEAAPNITLAELEARVARIGSGLLASGASSVIGVEWSPTDEVLCTLALLAASWM